MPERAQPTLAVGIVTRNRPESLRRSVASLELIADRLVEVTVVDDSSVTDTAAALIGVPPAVASIVRLVEQRHHEGYIVARNRIVREAAADYVLLMDDDAWLTDRQSVLDAVALLHANARVGAVACAMTTADGEPWDAAMQPAPVDYPCYVPSFIGFAHLLRRDLFLRLGGYEEALHFYGEEKGYCLQMLNAGYHVVYMPRARVVHAPDATGRTHTRYVRYVVRNDCLTALQHEPFPLPLLTVPLRLGRYLRMRGRDAEPGGLAWIVKELIGGLPTVMKRRRAIRWSTLRRWRALRRTWPAYVETSGT